MMSFSSPIPVPKIKRESVVGARTLFFCRCSLLFDLLRGNDRPNQYLRFPFPFSLSTSNTSMEPTAVPFPAFSQGSLQYATSGYPPDLSEGDVAFCPLSPPPFGDS